MDEAEEFDPGLIITTRCLTGLALVFFLARVAVQAVKRCDIRWDSLMLVASWIFLVVGATLIDVAFDLESHGPGISSSYHTRSELLGELARLSVVVSTALSKTSYGLMLLRLMNAQKVTSPHRKLRWFILFILVSGNLIIWPAALASLIGCQLGFSTEPGKSWPSEVDVIVGAAGTGWSGTADLVLALLPLEAIWDHKMRRLSRSLVIFAMVMGLVATVAAFTQCSQVLNNNTTTLAPNGFVFMLSSFTESSLTIIMAASLPIPQATSVSDGSAVDRTSQTGSRASTAFWHDRGRPEDVETTKNAYNYKPRPSLANTPAVSSGLKNDRHGHTWSGEIPAMPHGDMNRNTTEEPQVGTGHSAARHSKTSLFYRTWSTISSALQDLEPVWAHRRMEAALRRFSRPYTPSVYSSRTVDDDCTSTFTTRWDGAHIISRLSDIVEESWRDRSILKTPEPAALIYSTEKECSPCRGGKSDWDIENGSMI